MKRRVRARSSAAPVAVEVLRYGVAAIAALRPLSVVWALKSKTSRGEEEKVISATLQQAMV